MKYSSADPEQSRDCDRVDHEDRERLTCALPDLQEIIVEIADDDLAAGVPGRHPAKDRRHRQRGDERVDLEEDDEAAVDEPDRPPTSSVRMIATTQPTP